MNAVVPSDAQAKFAPARLPWHPAIEDRFKDLGVNKASWKVLAEAVFPGAKSADSIVMALSYCSARKLDPFKRPVHIVPMWDSQSKQMVETVWPGISEIRTTAFRTSQYAGCDEVEFGPSITREFKGTVGKGSYQREVQVEVTFPEWGRISVYRMLNGQRCKFVSPKVFWIESYGRQGASDVPNDMWAKRPSGQLEKCVEAAGLRKAFPEEVGNDYSAEEMHGQAITGSVGSVAIEGPPAPPADVIAEIEGPAAASRQQASSPARVLHVEEADIVETKPAQNQPATGKDETEETFDFDTWIEDVAGTFSSCRSESDLEEAHNLFGNTAEELLTRPQRERYDEMHGQAYSALEQARAAGQDPAGNPPAQQQAPQQDGPGVPPSEDDDDDSFGAPAGPSKSLADEHADWLTAQISAAGITTTDVQRIWNDSKPFRKEAISEGKMTVEQRNAMHARLKVVFDGLDAAEQAKARGSKPASTEKPASAQDKPQADADGDVAAKAKAMTDRLKAELAAAETTDQVNGIGTETFPERTALLEAGADPVLDKLWRGMVTNRRKELDDN